MLLSAQHTQDSSKRRKLNLMFSGQVRLVPIATLCVLAIPIQMVAANLCVNPAGSAGCSATIGAAVSAASAGDQITIAAGEYAEMVTVGKSISLIGAGSGATVINAKGQPNGILIDGLNNPGLNNVLVSGMTVTDANFEGILVAGASYTTISENHVTGNNQSLAAGKCPGIPAFET